jgi:N-acetyldiaminopimelate deacetylase
MWEQVIAPKYSVDHFFALHDSPEYAEGEVATRPGVIFAGCAGYQLRFIGKSGHGAMPHKCVDALTMGANFVTTIQTLISRNLDPVSGSVFSVGTFHSGNAFNQIAGTADLNCSVRFLERSTFEQIDRRVREIASGVAATFGGSVEIQLWDSSEQGYFPVDNDPALAADFAEFARSDSVLTFVDCPITMVSEDFGFLTKQIPSLLFWVGVGDPATRAAGISLHSSVFPGSEAVLQPTVDFIYRYLQHFQDFVYPAH